MRGERECERGKKKRMEAEERDVWRKGKAERFNAC